MQNNKPTSYSGQLTLAGFWNIFFFKFNIILPGTKRRNLSSLVLFCNIQSKFYLNDMHKHTLSIKYIGKELFIRFTVHVLCGCL